MDEFYKQNIILWFYKQNVVCDKRRHKNVLYLLLNRKQKTQKLDHMLASLIHKFVHLPFACVIFSLQILYEP